MSVYTFKQRRIMVREYQRIKTVSENGIENAIGFCKQGINQYNSSLKTPYGKAYEDELRFSMLVYFIFLKDNGII